MNLYGIEIWVYLLDRIFQQLFELNLYGIEILKMLEKYVAEKGFELNLYGIEISNKVLKSICINLFELNLYGIEMKIQRWLRKCLLWVWIEPLWNWNLGPTRSEAWKTAFELNLYGIEICNKVVTHELPSSLNWTFMELKW